MCAVNTSGAADAAKVGTWLHDELTASVDQLLAGDLTIMVEVCCDCSCCVWQFGLQ